MQIRDAIFSDFQAAYSLYCELAETNDAAAPSPDPQHWEAVISHSGTHVLCAPSDDALMAMLTLHLIPNVTYGAQPYALIENVIVAKTHRGQGYGRRIMETAIGTAWSKSAYKIMLLTGIGRSAQGFYHKLGFDDGEKQGMILRRPK